MAAPRDALAIKFRDFIRLEGRGYSPLYERLSALIAEDQQLLSILDDAPAHQRQPTLLFAAIHDGVLAHPDESLARWYPTVTGGPVPVEDVGPALRSFCATHEADLRTLVATRSTQTNEVLRCAALLLALDRIAGENGGPFGLVELGASAGLNLLCDRYSYDYADLGVAGDATSPVRLSTMLRGARRPRLPMVPRIASRTGIDLLPIDVRDPEATRWLRACLFADQLERQGRLRAALQVAQVDPPRLLRGDVLALLPTVAAAVPRDQHLCLISTWATHYLNSDQRRNLGTLLAEIGGTRDFTLIAAEPSGVVPGLAEPARSPQAPHATLLSILRFRRGRRADEVVAHMHSHAAWIEWLL
jgi:hypothetical protein